MIKIYCIKCKIHRNFKNPGISYLFYKRNFKNQGISYLFYKTLVIFIICGKCGSKCKRIFKDEKSIEILKILV